MNIKKLEKELNELKKEREIIPEFSMFGDENWTGMDKQIELLERLKAKPTDAELQNLINDCEVTMEEIENSFGDTAEEYWKMSKKRQPYQDTLEILETLK